MSASTVMNKLPKALRDELKNHHLYSACFTNESRTTVKDGFAMLVPQGVETMLRNRQELLLGNYGLDYSANDSDVVRLLRDIEVLRLFLTLFKEDSK